MKFLHTTFKVLIIIASVLALTLFILFAPSAFAQNPQFTPLVGLPGLQNMGNNTTIPEYINALYILIIVIGALIGVVKIALAGVKYSMTDIVTHKGEAKDDIQGVLLGLAILLIPFIVLNTINPNLTRLDVLQGVPKMDLQATTRTNVINTQTASPNERAAVLNGCRDTYVAVVGPNQYACANGDTPINTNNAANVDTNRVYRNVQELKDMAATNAPAGTFVVSGLQPNETPQQACGGAQPVEFKRSAALADARAVQPVSMYACVPN